MTKEDSPQLTDEQYYERLALEYALMRNEEPTFDTEDNDLRKYRGVILGSGIYEGGFYRVSVEIPRNFPFYPPIVVWLTKVWHPNISFESPGRVCESIFNRDWTPSLHVFSVIEHIRALLSYPNPDDPLNHLAAKEMKDKPEQFVKTAKKYVSDCATPENAFRCI